MRTSLRPRKRQLNDGFVDSSLIDFSDDELATSSRNPRLRRKRSRLSGPTELSDSDEDSDDTDDSDEASTKRRRRRRKQVQEPTRRSSRAKVPVQDYEDDEEEEEDDDDEDDIGILRSDVLQRGRKRKRRSAGRPLKAEKVPRAGVRQSNRTTRAQNNMQEADVDDIYRANSESRQHIPAPKVVSVREVFETLPRTNLFRSRHVEGCEVCYQGPNISPLIYCQGCSLSYHKNCIGTRSSRDHLVTKVAEEQFVLQCKRCINFYRRKDPSAPDLSKCQDCGQLGAACRPFKARKSPLQEQKDREENGGQELITDVAPHLINNALNILFRCTRCSRAYHYHHLPPLSKYSMAIDREEAETADERFQEYAKKWLCKECHETEELKVSTLIAWQPSDVESYRPGTACHELNEDDKQYLIKWEGQSYFQAAWHSGSWTWGVTAAVMRKAFFKREDGPKMRTEDAIPEEYLRIDIVLEVKYTSVVTIQSEEIDKARIKEVDRALIKYKGLGYEDAVWEKVPTPEDGDRWLDFVTAYNDWVAGRYIRHPKQGPLKARIDKARSLPFAKLEKDKQPDTLVGGELMKYQMEGLNWLYYQWYSQKNCILADEMGLGKTIQVIGFMATLAQEHNCYPFLVVVPNSTCANWRREIKQWVPSLRVVTFFGSAAARDMAYKYEMYPHGSKELRCHIVVTSYEAAVDDSSRRILNRINWAGLIVDEGQRLKNDKSQLYNALNAIKAPFRLLMTGTPLQNNARELFNLLQFLDDTIKAEELEEKYAEMTAETIRELHDQIRPFILRRTKKQVLTFLPALGQIIVPLSMSHLQKNVYKSILARNPELLKALFTSAKSLKQQERANLSNILMQLRKSLCHPFVYSREIEERSDVLAVSHRNLVEASAKLHLLELLLPKLRERGHRVLIFSQFLDMLSIVEDFLDGMQMTYQRLDGTMGSLEKQKRIDQFNAPDSPLFAFLLSTRAGGVGINLATADTVIILDPDFNPHQDLQAISRAHRIGQKKKVLCFQLMTRASVEEKIVQMGRKKMALDHVVVEQLGDEDVEEEDVESILKYGAAELFKDDNADHDIRYDDTSIEKLLDRSQIENTETNDDNSAESQFSFARVWANDTLKDTLDTPDEEVAPDPGVWDEILKERQAKASAEALARANALGRGKRARAMVAYQTEEQEEAPSAGTTNAGDVPPVKPALVEKLAKQKRSKKQADSDDDTDFQLSSSEGDDDDHSVAAVELEVETGTLDPSSQPRTKSLLLGQSSPHAGKSQLLNQSSQQSGFTQFRVEPSVKSGANAAQPAPPRSSQAPKAHAKQHSNSMTKPFVRAQLPVRTPIESTFSQPSQHCYVCQQRHPSGACPLKIAGAEHCGLCGLAHFGHARTCPHIRSETQVRDMLAALKNSPEKKELVDAAMKYLRGVKGSLVQQKKSDRAKAEQQVFLAANPHLRGQQGYQTGRPTASTAAPSSFQGPPRREVPSAFGPLAQVVPGSVGSHLQGQRPSSGHQQERSSSAAQPPIEDHIVEGALRGFLGH
jgi:chromodomain-helicase-DNA-binding protein 4